jgi:hypothetical protein
MVRCDSFANPLGPLPPTGTRSARIPGDYDCDCDTDLHDFAEFEACGSGPDVSLNTRCEAKDFDNDHDVDLFDFSVFQRCVSGDYVLVNLACFP